MVHWPIPWKALLPAEDSHLIPFLRDYCISFVIPGKRRSYYIHGDEWLYIHCHCTKPKSLQCKSAGVYFQNLVKRCVHGAQFDKVYWFFRRELSKLSSVFLNYVGSVYVNNVHLIYFNSSFMIQNGSYVRCTPWGEYVWVKGNSCMYVILICRSCNPLCEMTVNCCLRRCKRKMQYMLNLAPKSVRKHLGMARMRDRFLERLARLREPILFDRFDLSLLF
ncbi:E4-1 [Deer mastadenovirus B]|uniref:E4-1 n=1 Tax=Deer mastadenovirus B TaxID=2170000 RepID=A0A1Y0B6I4_9ADEN|nr:E4-1 [Deer mastadenovirus B]ART33381.1 E4-1 [Deer mastadenovirus B]